MMNNRIVCNHKNALIHKLAYFVTIPVELSFSLVLLPIANVYFFGRRYGVMKDFLKGAAVAITILIVLIIINMFCNMRGIDLDSTSTGGVTAVCAMLIYRGLIKNEKK